MEWAYVWDWSSWQCTIYLGGFLRWVWTSRGYRSLCAYPKR